MALNRISLVFQWHLLSSWWMVTWKWQSVATQEVGRCNIVPCPSRNNNRNNLGTQNFPGLHWRTEDPNWLPKMNFRGKQAFTKIDPSQHILIGAGTYLRAQGWRQSSIEGPWEYRTLGNWITRNSILNSPLGMSKKSNWSYKEFLRRTLPVQIGW